MIIDKIVKNLSKEDLHRFVEIVKQLDRQGCMILIVELLNLAKQSLHGISMQDINVLLGPRIEEMIELGIKDGRSFAAFSNAKGNYFDESGRCVDPVSGEYVDARECTMIGNSVYNHRTAKNLIDFGSDPLSRRKFTTPEREELDRMSDLPPSAFYSTKKGHSIIPSSPIVPVNLYPSSSPSKHTSYRSPSRSSRKSRSLPSPKHTSHRSPSRTSNFSRSRSPSPSKGRTLPSSRRNSYKSPPPSRGNFTFSPPIPKSFVPSSRASFGSSRISLNNSLNSERSSRSIYSTRPPRTLSELMEDNDRRKEDSDREEDI